MWHFELVVYFRMISSFAYLIFVSDESRRFGFANMSALSNGEVGTACRGEEHDVTFIWSVTSGKRTILFDGHEVHFSVNRMGVFDHSWTMKNNHVLKIIAHASPPLTPTPGFRQYDFFVDGQSFFSFPKVYRLGMSPNDPRAVPTSMSMAQSRRTTSSGSDRIASLEMPTNPDEVSLVSSCIRIRILLMF